MQLDAHAKALLEGLAAQGMKGFEEMTVPEARPDDLSDRPQ